MVALRITRRTPPITPERPESVTVVLPIVERVMPGGSTVVAALLKLSIVVCALLAAQNNGTEASAQRARYSASSRPRCCPRAWHPALSIWLERRTADTPPPRTPVCDCDILVGASRGDSTHLAQILSI